MRDLEKHRGGGRREDNYRGTDHIGKTGLEQRYEFELHGVTGHEQVEVMPAAAPCARCRARRRNRQQPDADHRRRSCSASPSRPSATASGALVAIEPATGGILALVSVPNYDPNLFVDGIDTQNWDASSTTAGQADGQPRL
jgi:penicillin-binding protein 2